MKEVRNGSLEKTFESWTARLDESKDQQKTALELYSGGHWSVVRSICNLKRSRETALKCHIVSAGYGLISISDKLSAYNATFTPGQPDSITTAGRSNVESCRIWWNALCTWKPANVKGERSFQEVFKTENRSLHVLALSPTYLNAVSDGLVEAVKFLAKKDNLIIVSSGTSHPKGLATHIVQSEARLQSILGGGLVSLNVRLAANIIRNLLSGKIKPAGVHRHIDKLKLKCKPRPTINRQIAKDSEVSVFIRSELKKNPVLSYTPLLHTFRDGGRACSMERFKTIFKKSKMQMYGKKKG